MFWPFIALLCILAIARTRRTFRLYSRKSVSSLTDEHIRQLEQHGSIQVDEPLDFSKIDDEESRFWNESRWDEPDEM